ncbi:hypothetical protein [Methylomonas koyamae]|nr:hypothetical protein [Methylomonas koyamae]
MERADFFELGHATQYPAFRQIETVPPLARIGPALVEDGENWINRGKCR